MKLLTAEEVASQLRVPPSWVYTAANDGRMPCVRLGRYVRFDPADVEAWVQAQKNGGNGAAR